MRSAARLCCYLLTLVATSSLLGDDVITNAMSPVVSYQYQNALDEAGASMHSPVVGYQYLNAVGEAQTAVVSPIVSYQYLEWAGFDVLGLNGSPRISYFYHGGIPLITQNPRSQIARLGTNVFFSVALLGTPPFHFDWQHDSQTIGTPSATDLALTNVQLVDSGEYRVAVADAYGSTTSSIARLNVYLPPTNSPPPPPTPTATTDPAPAELTARPRTPSSTNLIVFNEGGLVDPNKKTIVMTHGWNSSSGDWPTSMKNALFDKGFDNTVNILAWDWHDDAHTGVRLSYARSRTVNQGEALGAQLKYVLGPNYTKPIHFISHSLGTLVNCRAADFIHGDTKSTQNAIFKFNPFNTHITLLDEAELSDKSPEAFTLVFSVDAYSDWINSGKSKVIPSHYAWVDNYISEFGLLHKEAANVLLWRRHALPLIPDILGGDGLHAYAYEWYSNSIADPFGGSPPYRMGHIWSFERGSVAGAPSPDTIFQQSWNLNENELTVTKIGKVEAYIAYPSTKILQGANWLGDVLLGAYLDGIEYAGEFVANTVESFTPQDSQPVYVGTANSTPAYFTQPWESTGDQGAWNLEFSLQHPTAPISPQNLGPVAEGDTPNGVTNAVYVWLPIVVPDTSAWLSFQFRLDGCGTNEYFTMGISNETYYAMEAKYVEAGVWNQSPVMQIAEFAGQQARLFFSLNDDTMPKGKLSVRNIEFYIPPQPALSIERIAGNTVVSWPITAFGWQLEAADSIASSNEWLTVTNPPSVVNYQNTVTNSPVGSVRFFRLKQ